MLFEAIFTICMTNPTVPDGTHCRIMITNMSSTTRDHKQCIAQAGQLLAGVGREARKQFPQLVFHGEAVYCGSTPDYVAAVTSLIKSGYTNSNYKITEARF